jgi:ferric-dicitrate binding protein FerR (iron transport regulator)
MKTEILHRFFNGTASLSEEEEVKLWLAADPQNERILNRERKIFDIMTLMPDSMTPEVSMEVKAPLSRRLLREAVKAAVVAAVVLSGVYLWDSSRRGANRSLLQTVTVPAGQRVQLVLPDGSRVWLNAQTEVSYPPDFGKDSRMVNLRGEAYFEVSAGAKYPFVVKTPAGEARAAGSKFNVEYYASEGIFRTTLMSGKVMVASAESPGIEISLLPGKMLSLQAGGRFVEEAVHDYARYRWIEGLICFREASFIDVMKAFEKYYGASIRVRNESLGRYVFTGKFRHTDGVEYALRVLQRDVSFSYTSDNDAQVIYIE